MCSFEYNFCAVKLTIPVMIMAANPHVKNLKGFDPRTALAVDESFVRLMQQNTDMLEGGDDNALASAANEKSGKECGSLRTGGAINSGCTKIETGDGRTVFAASNIKGEIVFFEPAGDSLKDCGRITVQGALHTQAVYSDGIVYCVSRDGSAYAIDTGLNEGLDKSGRVSGEVIWQKKMNKNIFAAPVATGKVLIVTPADGIYGFDAYNCPDRKIGEALWSEPINGVVSTPVINSGMLFVGTEEKKLLGYDYGGSRVKKVWEYVMSGACRSRPFASEKTRQVVAGTIDGVVYAVARETGAYNWNFIVKAPVLSSIVPGNTADGECLLFGADNGYFYSLDQQGNRVWEFRASGKIRTEALVNEGRVYFGSEDASLYALDLRSGKQIFRFQSDGNIYGKPVIHEGRVYFGSTDGFIHSLYI